MGLALNVDQVAWDTAMKNDDDDGSPWWDERVEGIEDDKNSDFGMTRAWKEYREHLAGSSATVPLRGPSEWDLTKWSTEEKAPFSFDNDHDED